MNYTSESLVDEAYLTVSETFSTHRTKPLSWRIDQLRKTWWMIEDNKDRIEQVLYHDMHKHKQEALSVDAAGIQGACLEALQHLKEWAADEKPNRTDPVNLFTSTRIRKEPKGVALIMSAWNYPFMELFEPMICAISAGCTMVLKPSELAEASQDLIAEIVPKYLDQDAIKVVTSGPAGMDHILSKKWDHIFFTGSTVVGKIIYAKAAANLTTVTLELGGRGPAIVTANADIDTAAKRIASAKFMNAGQICLTVNHVFVDPSVKEQFIAALVKYFDLFRSGSSQQPAHYSHVINERNFNRLDRLLEQSKGKIIYGAERDAKTRYFSPTIVDGVLPSDSLMTEELFGPILPILDATLDEAISYTNKYDHPLALYGFTTSRAEKDKILSQTSSGGVTLNDCLLHMTAKGTPFGGVGASGIGAYHGPYGFKEFTHLRTVVDVPGWMEILFKFRYPPYTNEKAAAFAKFLGPVTKVPFDRHGKDTTSLIGRVTGLLAKLTIPVLLLVLLRWKGAAALDLIKDLKIASFDGVTSVHIEEIHNCMPVRICYIHDSLRMSNASVEKAPASVPADMDSRPPTLVAVDTNRETGDKELCGLSPATPKDTNDSSSREEFDFASEEFANIPDLVRNVVSFEDDPSLPVITFRSVLLSSFFCIIGSAASQIS
ncbi:hypothetical protein G7Z17_g1394 [Cylindrodendrum hubeiense]|uniref:Beta-apo-4'-carotenal oxygenase n=1 Tax=Cylindrodendrum hubeiense TaxID=595255 RepID=A0A9P5LFE1_9HYPO|nr:hypothetical protein G7Z17_g1394 [Cylindrodendrum hubeiense]